VWLFWNNGSEASYDVIPQCAAMTSFRSALAGHLW